MKKIRFALVGCGRIAHRHAEQIMRVGELVAVCDIVPEKALLLSQPSGAAMFPTIESLLGSGLPIDILVICTPNGWHARQAVQAMQAGCHVLVEKPLALTVRDADEILAVSRQTGRRLYTVVQNRFNPPVVETKKALDKGAFGQISSVQVNCYWHRDEDYYRNSWHGTIDLDGG
ncbi:MAG TPA: Gfo/Idh/MocA family oxidoreductase, partial [Sediminibacterium sp.]|nr:Gfo/Idh/MocA family oxidoreductase [Sediminibacterium sp.]